LDFSIDELAMISQLKQAQGIAPRSLSPFARNRRFPRGDRRVDIEGKKIGPWWKTDPLERTGNPKYDRAFSYLSGRKLLGNRASNIKKLSKAARLMR
jgi:hypothetical protein